MNQLPQFQDNLGFCQLLVGLMENQTKPLNDEQVAVEIINFDTMGINGIKKI